MNSAQRSVSTRFLNFVGDLHLDSVQSLLSSFDTMKHQDGVKSIELTLTSTGGHLNAAFAAFDYLRAYSKPVTIIATGICQSSAIVLLQAGATRASQPHTQFRLFRILHQLPEWKTLKEIRTDLAASQQREETFYEILAHHATVDTRQVRNLCNAERAFSPEEALRFGLIDVINK